jgi:fido (protein-threonine AMPylation protein)
MATTSPHIHFNGNAEEAFEFYRSVLGGQFIRVMRLKICLLNWWNANPFREGNGRFQRLFISQLAEQAGYTLDYSALGQEEIYSVMQSFFLEMKNHWQI